MGRKRKRLPAAGERSLKQVWLVQPPIGGTKIDVTPPLGALVLAAVLEAEGYKPQVADLNLAAKTGKIDPKRSLRTQFVQALPKRKSHVDLIGVTTWSYNFDVSMEFVEAIRKKHPQAPIVLGGPHVTFVDEEVLRTFDSVDFVLRDEGDLTFPRLVAALERGGSPEDLAAIEGLTWRRGKEVVRNPSGGVVEDLDALPYPAYHLVDTREYLACQPTLIVEAGRGCPYNCNFCSTTNMFQRKYRVKSAPRLVDEIEWAMKATGTNRFELLHDNLVANKPYVLELCQEIRARNLDVDWSCTSRTDNLTEEVAHQMFLAGCGSVFFGVESLSAERQKWTGKRLKPPKIEEAVELTRRQHLIPGVGIILGFPDETDEELDATLGAAVRWTTDPRVKAEVSTAVLRYYPGADLFAHKDALRHDPTAAADSASVPGYAIRPEWRDRTALFPLQSIHTPVEETRTNLLRRNFVRSLLKVAPLTFRACLEVLGHRPKGLLDAMQAAGPRAGGPFRMIEERRTNLMWNESVEALGAIIDGPEHPRGSPDDVAAVRELLTCEVPFWETLPVAEPLDHLEHTLIPKRFDQEQLVAFARGERQGLPEEVQGVSILAIRAGSEAVVWITDKAEQVLETFQRSYAEDRRATMAYVESLQRGL
jgi:radical SAM superfamily enzyme YgiQ (UPF0313 family)